MPKVIIITDVDLESYYNLTMEYLDIKYHRFPVNFEDFQISDAAEAQISALNAAANQLCDQVDFSRVPIGKTVL